MKKWRDLLIFFQKKEREKKKKTEKKEKETKKMQETLLVLTLKQDFYWLYCLSLQKWQVCLCDILIKLWWLSSSQLTLFYLTPMITEAVKYKNQDSQGLIERGNQKKSLSFMSFCFKLQFQSPVKHLRWRLLRK